MKTSPAFQFYPADFLADENVAVMSLAGRGAYITLMCYCWREGSIPADPDRLAKLCGVDGSAMQSYMAELLPCFQPSETQPGRLIHPRLEAERVKQQSYSAERSQAGLRGAKSRWQKDLPENRQPVAANGSAMAQPMAQPMANDGSSSSSSSLEDSSVTQKSLKSKRSGQPNPLYEIFAAAFQEKNRLPYLSKRADFVQLDSLKKKSANASWELTQERFQVGVNHYFQSEIGQFTLADLCTRFSTFFKSPLDRFNKPILNGENTNGQQHTRFESASERSTRRLAERDYDSIALVAAGHAGGIPAD